MFYGTNFGVGRFIYQSVIPVTLGNIVAGALFTGAFLWFLYGRNTTLAVERGQPLSGEATMNGGTGSHGWEGSAPNEESIETVTAGENRNGLPRRRAGGDMV